MPCVSANKHSNFDIKLKAVVFELIECIADSIELRLKLGQLGTEALKFVFSLCSKAMKVIIFLTHELKAVRYFFLC